VPEIIPLVALNKSPEGMAGLIVYVSARPVTVGVKLVIAVP
jgi:hypothetical protein